VPKYLCRYICGRQKVIGEFISDYRNPAEAAEDADSRRRDLQFALIEVWDGETRILIWKKAPLARASVCLAGEG
jgi:hypothetical protein